MVVSTGPDIEQIKAALLQLHTKDAAAPHRAARAKRSATDRRETADLHALAQRSTEVGELGAILRRRRDERRQELVASLAASKTDTKRHTHATAASVAAVAEREHALRLLAQPFTSTFEQLDKPFLIWQMPHPELNIFVDSHIESLASWVKVFLQTNSGTDNTTFNFYFLWSNPSDYYAVANISSSLILNGQASAWGESGILHGNTATLDMDAVLSVYRWSGWGSDPTTGVSYDQTPYPIYDAAMTKNIVSYDAYGGDWFDDADVKGEDFDPQTPYDVEAHLLAIPGRAVILVEVGLKIFYWFHDGAETDNEDYDNVTVDLAYDPLDYKAVCPMVQLEILTPPA